MVQNLSTPYLLIIAGIIGLASFSVGRFTQEKEIQIQEVVKETKVVDQEAIKVAVEEARKSWVKEVSSKTTTVTNKKPTGEETITIIVETEEKEEVKVDTVKTETSTEKKIETVIKEETKKETIVASAPRYSLGAKVHKELDNVLKEAVLEKTDYSVNAGMRIVGGIWFELDYQVKKNQAGLGLRFEF